MRILAIRGRNLTALAGDFALELDAPPLAGVGLFAITGPTGSGKSSLLDALCLALFDRTPRLAGGSSVKDEDGVTATDPRHLLRRGCAEGHAEVDFADRHGRRHRARWSVWRARNRADGKLQDSIVELRELDGTVVFGGKKTEVLEEIQRRLGLDYEQFTRSALLAQGEFAGFLRAPPKKRAELLERMTGTEIYRRISQQAHLRHSEATREHAQLTQLQQSDPPLSTDARTAIEAQRAEASSELAPVREALESATRAVAFHQKHDELLRELGAAESRLQQARRLRAAEDATAALIAEVQSAEPLREPLQQHDELVQNQRQSKEVRAASEAAVTRARVEVDLAQAKLEQLRENAAALEQKRSELGPELTRARELDVRLVEQRRARVEAEAECVRRRALREQAARALGELETQFKLAQELGARSQASLEVSAALEPLTARWEPIEAELVRFLRDLGQRQSVETQKREQERAVEVLAPRLSAAKATANELAASLERARAEAIHAEEALAEHPREALVEARQKLELRGSGLSQREAISQAASSCQSRRDQARASAQHAAESIVGFEKELTALDEAVRTEAVRLDEARRAQSQARTQLDLAAHRAKLVPGEQCPLCGATEHPFAESGLAIHADALDTRVSELEVELQTARQEVASVREKRAASLSQGGLAKAQLAREDAEFASLEARWSGPNLPGSVQATAALAEEKSALEADRVEVAARETEAEGRLQAVRIAQQGILAAKAALDASGRVQGELDAEQALAVQRLEQLGVRIAQIGEDLGALRASLVTQMPADWETSLARDGQPFIDGLRESVLARRTHQASANEARIQREALAPRIDDARANRDARTLELDASEKSQSGIRNQLSALELERAALLGGASATEVEAGIGAQLASAQAAVKLASESSEQSKAVLAEGERESMAELVRANELTERATVLSAQISKLLSELGLELSVARARLRHEASWLRQTEGHLAALDQACRESASVLADRRARLQAHQALPAPVHDLAGSMAAVASAQLRVDVLFTREVELRSQIEQDQVRLQKWSERGSELARAEAEVRRWGELDALIGASDGARFQKFAQGLTLDLLLELANAQLHELAPRYGLQRVPGFDLELQVIDRDMGDETRSVNSLSGGESFLASLALALGLSNLAAQTTAVDSLFIDEGFGTLDPDTLEVALAALENLQAQGRQVGLISHVASLAERVGAQVQLRRRGAGRSELMVFGAEATIPSAIAAEVSTRASRRRSPKGTKIVPEAGDS